MFLRRGEVAWKKPESNRFSAERDLQFLVADQPNMLPLVQAGAVSVQEFATDSGPLDVCVVDHAGGITLVECKLASNLEIRRKVVGQVLDYAAQIWRLPFNEFDTRWRNRSGGPGVLESLGAADESALEIRSTMESALVDGRFNLILAVDAINEPLRTIVEYLNSHTAPNTAVVAVEFKRFKWDLVEVLVPVVYGLELVESKPGRKRFDWSEQDLEDHIAQQNPELLETVHLLLNGMRDLGLEFQGTQAQTPSVAMHSTYQGRDILPVAIYASSRPRLQINFGGLRILPTSLRAACADRLAQTLGSDFDAISLAESGYTKYPNVFLDTLQAHPGGVEGLIEAFALLLSKRATDSTQ